MFARAKPPGTKDKDRAANARGLKSRLGGRCKQQHRFCLEQPPPRRRKEPTPELPGDRLFCNPAFRVWSDRGPATSGMQMVFHGAGFLLPNQRRGAPRPLLSFLIRRCGRTRFEGKSRPLPQDVPPPPPTVLPVARSRAPHPCARSASSSERWCRSRG